MTDIDPAVELLVDRRAVDVRHEMRSEIATVAASVAAVKLEQAREIARLEGRISELEQRKAVDAALVKQSQTQRLDLRQNRRWIIGTGLVTAGVVIGALQLLPN